MNRSLTLSSSSRRKPRERRVRATATSCQATGAGALPSRLSERRVAARAPSRFGRGHGGVRTRASLGHLPGRQGGGAPRRFVPGHQGAASSGRITRRPPGIRQKSGTPGDRRCLSSDAARVDASALGRMPRHWAHCTGRSAADVMMAKCQTIRPRGVRHSALFGGGGTQ